MCSARFLALGGIIALFCSYFEAFLTGDANFDGTKATVFGGIGRGVADDVLAAQFFLDGIETFFKILGF